MTHDAFYKSIIQKKIYRESLLIYFYKSFYLIDVRLKMLYPLKLMNYLPGRKGTLKGKFL